MSIVSKIYNFIKNDTEVEVINNDIRYTINADGSIHVNPIDILNSKVGKEQLDAQLKNLNK